MTELEPCPFCGGDASLTHYRDSIIVWVECCKCGSSTIHRKLNEQAIEAWNTRAERTSKMIDLETGEQANYECEEHVFHCVKCNADRGVYAYNEDGDVWAEMPNYCPNCGAKVVIE